MYVYCIRFCILLDNENMMNNALDNSCCCCRHSHVMDSSCVLLNSYHNLVHNALNDSQNDADTLDMMMVHNDDNPSCDIHHHIHDYIDSYGHSHRHMMSHSAALGHND